MIDPTDTYVPSKERQMPPMSKIIDYWKEHTQPWMKPVVIGWGEPCCFACGWMPPVLGWNQANAFLDRAHLQDHVVCGDDSPSNLVPLCHLCHSVMPEFDDRQQALDWVKSRYERYCTTRYLRLLQESWQSFTDNHPNLHNPSRNTMFRLRVVMLEIFLQELNKHPEFCFFDHNDW